MSSFTVYLSAIVASLSALAVIILCVGFGLKLLGDILNVGKPVYIDEDTEGYINGPNRWD